MAEDRRLLIELRLLLLKSVAVGWPNLDMEDNCPGCPTPGSLFPSKPLRAVGSICKVTEFLFLQSYKDMNKRMNLKEIDLKKKKHWLDIKSYQVLG